MISAINAQDDVKMSPTADLGMSPVKTLGTPSDTPLGTSFNSPKDSKAGGDQILLKLDNLCIDVGGGLCRCFTLIHYNHQYMSVSSLPGHVR